MRALCALISINSNSDDSGTSFPCLAKLIRSAMSPTSLLHTIRDINDSETVFRNYKITICSCQVSVCKMVGGFPFVFLSCATRGERQTYQLQFFTSALSRGFFPLAG